jgi:hypothetical protein
MTDREIEIIDAVGEYVDRKFGDNAHEGESYTEEAQDYFNELLDRVEDAYNDTNLLAFPCPNCCYDVTWIDPQDGDLVMAGHDCSNDENVEPYTLISIDDVAREMYQDEMATRTLKYHLGL